MGGDGNMRTSLRAYLQSECTGWRPLELAWLATATGVILGLSLFWGDAAPGILAALTGVWCVILTGKGKRSSFLFGTVNVLLYAWIAFGARYYGEVMLNLLYYVPMQFVGFFVWSQMWTSPQASELSSITPFVYMYTITFGTQASTERALPSRAHRSTSATGRSRGRETAKSATVSSRSMASALAVRTALAASFSQRRRVPRRAGDPAIWSR